MAAVNLAKQVGTTKGDLYVYNGSTLVRLPVGTDDQVLTADAAQAAGVKWAASGSGGGGVTEIETVTVSASTPHIEFGSIPSGYSELVVEAYLRSDQAAQTDEMRLQVGNLSVDTGASSYAFASRRIGTSTDASTSSQGNSSVLLRAGAQGGSATAGWVGTAIFRLPGYDSSRRTKPIRGEGEIYSTSNFNAAWVQALWISGGDPITVVRLFPEGGSNWTAGTATLLGID